VQIGTILFSSFFFLGGGKTYDGLSPLCDQKGEVHRSLRPASLFLPPLSGIVQGHLSFGIPKVELKGRILSTPGVLLLLLPLAFGNSTSSRRCEKKREKKIRARATPLSFFSYKRVPSSARREERSNSRFLPFLSSSLRGRVRKPRARP